MSQNASVAALRQQGLEAMKRGDLDTAIDVFTRLLQETPGNAEIQAALGIAKSQKGRHEEGLRLLEQAIQQKPTSVALRYNHGLALERAGRRLAAAEAYEAAIQLNPDHAQSRQRLQALEQAMGGGAIPLASAEPEEDLPLSEPEDGQFPSAEVETEAPEPSPTPPPRRHQPGRTSWDEPAVRASGEHAPVGPQSARRQTSAQPSRPTAVHQKPDASPRKTDMRTDRPAEIRKPTAPSQARSAPPAPPQESLPSATVLPDPAPADDEILDVLPADPMPASAGVPATDSRPESPQRIEPLLLAEGEAFDSHVKFEVAGCDENHLLLRSRSAGSIGWIVAGPVSLILTVLLVYHLIVHIDEAARIRVRSIFGMGMGVLIAIGLFLTSLLKISQIGMTLRFDRLSGTLERRRFFGLFGTSWSRDELQALRFSMPAPAESADEQDCAVELIGTDGEVLGQLGGCKAADPGAGPLLRIAAWAARVLDLPLEVRGKARSACRELKDSLAVVNQPAWPDQTPLRSIGRSDAIRKGYVVPPGRSVLILLAKIFFTLLALGFMGGLGLLAYLDTLPWIGATVMAALLGVAALLIFGGAEAIRTRRTGNLGGKYLKGSNAVAAGTAQLILGIVLTLAMPIIAFFNIDIAGAIARYKARQAIEHAGDDGPAFKVNPGSPREPGPPRESDPFRHAWNDLQSNDHFRQTSAALRLRGLPANDQRIHVATRLLALLQGGPPTVRVPCVEALETWGSEQEAPALMLMLADPDANVRRSLINTLSKMKAGSQTDAAAVAIAGRLTDLRDRQAALLALRNMKGSGERAALGLVQTNDAVLRRDVITLLRDVGTAASLPALQELANSSDTSIARLAATARRAVEDRMRGGGTSGTPPITGGPDTPPTSPTPPMPTNSVDQAIVNLKSASKQSHEGACEFLAKAQPNERRDDVSRELADCLRRAADRFSFQDRDKLAPAPVYLKALLVWGTKDAVPTVVKALESSDLETRVAACEVLGQLKDDRAIPPLVERMKRAEDRKAAAKALESIGQPAEAELAKVLDNFFFDKDAKIEAATLLKSIATKESVPTLIEALQKSDKETRLRGLILSTLARLKDTRAADPVAKLLLNPVDREAASQTLIAMGPGVETVVVKGLAANDPEVRAEVCRILKVIGTKDSIPYLMNVAKRSDPVTMRLAREAWDAINNREKK